MGRRRSPETSALRIIGGEWRGRKVSFSPQPGLRPTGDRVRETLFNWLAPHIVGARCLDLFAGSGILGIEALSRGAASSDFIDNQPENAARIKHQLTALNVMDKGVVHCGDALTWLTQNEATWDIVFIDPPFDSTLAEPALQQLASHTGVHQQSWVYVETRQSQPERVPEALYDIVRDKNAGDVRYQLLQLRQC